MRGTCGALRPCSITTALYRDFGPTVQTSWRSCGGLPQVAKCTATCVGVPFYYHLNPSLCRAPCLVDTEVGRICKLTFTCKFSVVFLPFRVNYRSSCLLCGRARSQDRCCNQWSMDTLYFASVINHGPANSLSPASRPETLFLDGLAMYNWVRLKSVRAQSSFLTAAPYPHRIFESVPLCTDLYKGLHKIIRKKYIHEDTHLSPGSPTYPRSSRWPVKHV